MADEEFYTAVEIAKRIERAMLPYAPFDGKIEVTKTLDFYPKEYCDFSYGELLNYYDRIGKVIKTSKMDIYSMGQTEQPQVVEKQETRETVKAAEETKAKTEEVETKVKEITATSLETAEEMKAAEPIEKIEEKIKVAEERKPDKEEIEFESLDFEKPEEKRVERPIITPQQTDRKEEHEKKGMIPAEEAQIKTGESAQALPPALEVTPQEAASIKYQEIEDHFKREWKGEIDEQKIKKKMLELTKELFKEKSVHARDRIKSEIAALKGMFSKFTTRKRKGTESGASYSPAFFESLVGAQHAELTATKDTIMSSVNGQLEAIKRKFYDKLASIGEREGRMNGRKAAYEQFVFELTSISEQLGPTISKQEEFILQKHMSETEEFISKLPKEDKKIGGSAEERRAMLEPTYRKDFSGIKEILTKNIETTIDRAGHSVFKEEGEQAKGEEAPQILFEINETDEATLLYYLHSKDSEVYKKYERKHLSKHEAVHYAKILMAKEKGLSDDIITKYFGQFTQTKEKDR